MSETELSKNDQKEAAAAAKAAEREAKKAAEAEAKAQAKAEAQAKKEAEAAAKAAKAAEREAAKQAKADAAAAKIAEREANRQPEQNGIRRPKPEGICGKIWEIADKLSTDLQAPVQIAPLIEATGAKGINAVTTRTNYARWRKFHGITGRTVAVASE